MPPSFSSQFQETILWILPKTMNRSPTGLSPCIVLLSRKLWVWIMVIQKVHNTTSPSYYYDGFSLDWAAFARCYSRHLNWFLFLQVLRRFNSLRSPTPKGFNEMSHSEIPGSKPTFSSPGHFVACHVLHRRFEPSHPPSSVQKRYNTRMYCKT